MNHNDKIFTRLGIIRTENELARITLKKDNIEFVAEVIEFLYDEDETKVILAKSSSTKFFPTNEERFTCYFHEIKSVFIHE